jgi:hypothetical protein
MIIDTCPVCGDFDIGDWCNHCGVPTKEVDTSAKLRPDEEAEVEAYYSRQYEEYIQELLKKQAGEGE